MKYLIIFTLLICHTAVFPIKDAIGRYILNDVDASVLSKSRIQYAKNAPHKWQAFSNLMVDVSFPKINTYLGLSPHLEFGHLSNHALTPHHSVTRLTESYIDVHLSMGTLSIGEKRLAYEGGRFVSDSGFNLLPRTFGQLSYKTLNDKLHLTYLTHMTAPDSTDRHYYQKGSYILAVRGIDLVSPLLIDLHAYLLEDIGNTYSLGSRLKLADGHQLSSTLAYQSEPCISTQPVPASSTFFHDAIYRYTIGKQSLRFGTRFFQAGKSNTNGFSAPYSSGHLWDGYLNTYQSHIKRGFTRHFRSIFGSFSTALSKSRAINLQWYLFRNHSLTQNLGTEIDIAIQDAIIRDAVYWAYKVGQFIPGSHSDAPSELKMWLDFSIKLGTSD